MLLKNLKINICYLKNRNSNNSMKEDIENVYVILCNIYNI